MRSLGSRAGLLFSLSFTTLVFFNYLYFLKWWQPTGSRLWVVALIAISAPFAVLAFRDWRKFAVPGAIILAYVVYMVLSYFAFRTMAFDIRYLCQFILTVLPFFGAGILAGWRPGGLIVVVMFAGIALLLALPVAWIQYGSLWEGDDFRDVLAIPQVPGRAPYYSYYQLVAYGIALSAIPSFVWLLGRTRLPIAYVVGLGVTLLLAELGSRTMFLLLPIVLAALVFRIKGVAQAAIYTGLSAILVAGVFYAPIAKNLSVVQRTEGEAERYEQGAIFQPKTDAHNPYDAAGAFDTGDGGDHRTWSRRTLFEFALKGWLSNPASAVFGRGLGSYSLDLAGVYPGWLPAQHSGEIYPHNWILEAGYEGGAIAVLLLGVVLVFPFWRILSEWETSASSLAIAGMYLLIFGAAFFSGGIALNYTLFFLAGAALSAQSLYSARGK